MYVFPSGNIGGDAGRPARDQRLTAWAAGVAEDPTTGVVAPEAVQAVIDDGAKPLMALDLSDGAAITVAADHPFYVDRGALLRGSGWLHAGDLWPGDELRTAGGKSATVVELRRNVGEAVVYTLI